MQKFLDITFACPPALGHSTFTVMHPVPEAGVKTGFESPSRDHEVLDIMFIVKLRFE